MTQDERYGRMGGREKMPDIREITSVEIGGRDIEAEKVVCPECKTLWLDTDFDTADPVVWKATCPKGHTWEFCW